MTCRRIIRAPRLVQMPPQALCAPAFRAGVVQKPQPMQQALHGAQEPDSMHARPCPSPHSPYSRYNCAGCCPYHDAGATRLAQGECTDEQQEVMQQPSQKVPHLCIHVIGFKQLSIHVPPTFLANRLHMDSCCFHNVNVAELAGHHTCIKGTAWAEALQGTKHQEL